MPDYLTLLKDHIVVVEPSTGFRSQIERTAGRIADRLRACGAKFWVGKGGSAAEAQHLSARLIGQLPQDRAGVASIRLNADIVALTVMSSEHGHGHVSARQVEAPCGSGDGPVSLLPATVAGVSPRRFRWEPTECRDNRDVGSVRRRSRKTSDRCLCVASDDTEPVQATHLFIDRAVHDHFEKNLSRDESYG